MSRLKQISVSFTPGTKVDLRLAMLVVLSAIILSVPTARPAFAKGAKQADAKAAPAVDPDAIDALNKMSTYLRSLKGFQVIAETTTDDVTDEGQTIQSSRKIDMLATFPNHLRVEITGDDVHRLYFYDGKNFTIFAALAGYYATVPAPATTVELINNLYDKYGLELPLIDLFKFGHDETLVKRIKAADDIGPANVGGVTCEQYAFRQEGTDWQIWIQLGEFPLPRKLVITTLTDDARPQHSEVLTWNLAPSFNEQTFNFEPPAGAGRIAIEEVKAASDKKD
jgi:hypothetical protein